MKRTDEPLAGLDRRGDPIVDPAPDKRPTWEDTPAGKASFKGANWGMAVGLAVTSYYTSSFGYYQGDAPVVIWLLSGCALGYIAGAAVAWASVKLTGKDEVPPTSFMDGL